MNTKKAIVLIADAAADKLISINGMLQEHYEVLLANQGAGVLQLMQQVPRPDLVLLDADLPDMDGYSVCQQLKSSPDTAEIPVLLMQQQPDEARALLEGAADVLHKPLIADLLRARVAAQLEIRHSRELLKQQRNLLEHVVEELTIELSQMLDAMIWALASLAETREYETANHLRRVQHYVAALGRQLRHHPRFAEELSEANIKALFKAAPLHDIGKVSIPDAILLKPDRLTEAEFAVIKLHTVYGRDAIVAVENQLGYSNTFLRFAKEITYSHQEKYDGSGYPQALVGDAIPISARLMAVADVYDALISKRVYKPAFSHETAMEMIRQGSGEHFDPDVVDAMLTIEEEFMEIAARYRDDEQAPQAAPAALE